MSLGLAPTQDQESPVWLCVDVITPPLTIYIKEEQVGNSLCLRQS